MPGGAGEARVIMGIVGLWQNRGNGGMMENQMEKNMENEMETGFLLGASYSLQRL